MYIILKNPIKILETDNQNNYSEKQFVKMPVDWTPPSCPVKYLKWSSEEIDLEEMTADEKKVVDDAEIAQAKVAKEAELVAEAKTRIEDTVLEGDTVLQGKLTELKTKNTLKDINLIN